MRRIFLSLALLLGLASGAIAQIGPYSGNAGSSPTAPLVPSIGGSAFARASTAAPTGTASTTPVMCGCAVLIQPGQNGIILVAFTFSITNGTATDGAAVQIAFGQGAAPANGAAAVGTTVGSVHTWVGGTTTSGTGLATVVGLFQVAPPTPAAPYWIDLQFKAVTGGTATLTAVDGVATES